MAADHLLPAGRYTVRVSDDAPSIVFLESADGQHAAILDTLGAARTPGVMTTAGATTDPMVAASPGVTPAGRNES